jgi:hypothetical protein
MARRIVPAAPQAPAERSELSKKLDALNRRFGQGETYSRRDQALIHHKIVPEWVVRVARLHPDVHMRGHAANLIDQVEILRKEGFPAVKLEGEDDHGHV